MIKLTRRLVFRGVVKAVVGDGHSEPVLGGPHGVLGGLHMHHLRVGIVRVVGSRLDALDGAERVLEVGRKLGRGDGGFETAQKEVGGLGVGASARRWLSHLAKQG